MFAKSLCRRAGTAVRCSSLRIRTMPLKAKIISPAFVGRAQMSTSVKAGAKEEAAKVEKPVAKVGDEVLFDTIFGLRTVELNRPKSYHALNKDMITEITPRLLEWQKSDMANVVVLKGSGPKAFCAGGDVVALAKDNKLGEEGQKRSADYFASEYKLNHLIATYTKPLITFMDGITMGGGVGLSIHAPFRIATERTVFAMPETTIGFFPDVGASFFLPRMPGAVGTYLALTSDRIKGANVYYSGIATHYIHSTTLPALEHRLSELRFKDYDPLETRLELVNSTIEEFSTGLPHDEPIVLGGELRKAIDRCFAKNTVSEILAALKAEEGETKKWAEQTLETLQKRSPTAVHVALRQMRLGRQWSIAETFQREHLIASKFMAHSDFVEGIDALLIRKTNDPAWKPESLDKITDKDSEAITEHFFKAEGSERLPLLTSEDYKTYPWAQYSIPSEEEVGKVWMEGGRSKRRVADIFAEQRRGKQGIQEIVLEILRRRGIKDEEGKVGWISLS